MLTLMQHQQLQQQEYMTLGVPILPDGYVFAMPFGTCVEPSTMRDALNYLLTAAGIEHANFHSLRHTFATRAIEAGIPVKTLNDILGHSQVQITIPVPNSNTKPTQYLSTANPNITMKMATPYKSMVLPFFSEAHFSFWLLHRFGVAVRVWIVITLLSNCYKLKNTN